MIQMVNICPSRVIRSVLLFWVYFSYLTEYIKSAFVKCFHNLNMTSVCYHFCLDCGGMSTLTRSLNTAQHGGHGCRWVSLKASRLYSHMRRAPTPPVQYLNNMFPVWGGGVREVCTARLLYNSLSITTATHTQCQTVPVRYKLGFK